MGFPGTPGTFPGSVSAIDRLVTDLDTDWIESEKVRDFVESRYDRIGGGGLSVKKTLLYPGGGLPPPFTPPHDGSVRILYDNDLCRAVVRPCPGYPSPCGGGLQGRGGGKHGIINLGVNLTKVCGAGRRGDDERTFHTQRKEMYRGNEGAIYSRMAFSIRLFRGLDQSTGWPRSDRRTTRVQVSRSSRRGQRSGTSARGRCNR